MVGEGSGGLGVGHGGFGGEAVTLHEVLEAAHGVSQLAALVDEAGIPGGNGRRAAGGGRRGEGGVEQATHVRWRRAQGRRGIHRDHGAAGGVREGGGHSLDEGIAIPELGGRGTGWAEGVGGQEAPVGGQEQPGLEPDETRGRCDFAAGESLGGSAFHIQGLAVGQVLHASHHNPGGPGDHADPAQAVQVEESGAPAIHFRKRMGTQVNEVPAPNGILPLPLAHQSAIIVMHVDRAGDAG